MVIQLPATSAATFTGSKQFEPYPAQKHSFRLTRLYSIYMIIENFYGSLSHGL